MRVTHLTPQPPLHTVERGRKQVVKTPPQLVEYARNEGELVALEVNTPTASLAT